eukprot:3883726-Amphidinium_carterae.1
MRLDNETVNFFYIESKNSFPLYTAATKFFGNRDQMVRANVRTITLQVLGSISARTKAPDYKQSGAKDVSDKSVATSAMLDSSLDGSCALTYERFQQNPVQDFILRHAAESYCGQLVQHVQELWQRLDAAAVSNTENESAVRRENELQQDLLIYLSDVFELGVEKLNELLANRLLGS